MSSSDNKNMWKQVKPQAPDCEGMQFADYPSNNDFQTPGSNYFDVSFDAKNNVIPDNYQDMHKNMPAGESRYGSMQFAESDGIKGENQIFTPEDASSRQNLQKISVDTSRADRGREV